MSEKYSKYYGKFCWIELETPDIKGSKAFYSELLNWNYKDMPSPDGGSYTIGQNGEEGVCGIAPGNSPHWTTYVFVENLDETTKKAEKLGATVTQKPTDVPGMGRFSIFKDPTGATFALWQSTKDFPDHGPYMKNTPGSCCWLELATNNVSKASQFYTELHGWTAKQSAPKDDYIVFYKGDTMVGGLLQIEKDWKGIDPQWFVYFSVDDCDKKAEQAKRMKAQVGVGPTDIPTIGRFCMLKDPQGAHVALIKLLPMEEHSKTQTK